jgi:hypothetical protein
LVVVVAEEARVAILAVVVAVVPAGIEPQLDMQYQKDHLSQ